MWVDQAGAVHQSRNQIVLLRSCGKTLFLLNFGLNFAANVFKSLIQAKDQQEHSLCFPQASYIRYIKDGGLMVKLNKAVRGTEPTKVNFIFFSISASRTLSPLVHLKGAVIESFFMVKASEDRVIENQVASKGSSQ